MWTILLIILYVMRSSHGSRLHLRERFLNANTETVKQAESIEPIEVENHEQLYADYSSLLNSGSGPLLFHLKDTDTFLTRVDLENMNDETMKDPWVEFSLHREPSTEEFYGYVPISPCFSLEYGANGVANFIYTYTYGFSFSKDANAQIQSSFMMASIGAALKSSFGFGVGVALGDSYSCEVLHGDIGQIWLKPKLVQTRVEARGGRYSARLKRLVMSNDIIMMTKILSMASENTHSFECVTTAVVADLNCSSVRIGQVDFNHPVGLDYE